jgi:hypothetical protein
MRGWHDACGYFESMNRPFEIESDQHTPSDRYSDYGRTEHVSGLVQHVDLVGRDMKVLIHTDARVFDIPPDCLIFLHGEQVKLRMVQPNDRVRITFKRTQKGLVAKRLDIQPDAAISYSPE